MMKNLLIGIVLILFPMGAIQAADVPDETAKADVPQEPNKNLQRRLWEGAYRADLNTLYHLTQANEVHGNTQWLKWIGILLSTLGLTPIFWAAVAPRSRQKKAEGWSGAIRTYKPIASVIFSVVLFGMGQYLSIWTPEVDQRTHSFLATEWRELANEWHNARDQFKAGLSLDLEAEYRRLQARQETIESREPPELFHPDKMREAQQALNHRLELPQA